MPDAYGSSSRQQLVGSWNIRLSPKVEDIMELTMAGCACLIAPCPDIERVSYLDTFSHSEYQCDLQLGKLLHFHTSSLVSP